MPDEPKPNGDPVDAAIAKVGTVAMRQIPVTIASTGRPFVIAIPTDMTEPELLEVVGWMTTALRQALAQERTRTAGGRIILPS